MDTFEFKADDYSADEIFADISAFLLYRGNEFGEVTSKNDPDGTFVILKKEERIQVLLTEGEAKGMCVFLMTLEPRSLVTFEPGPWINRVKALATAL